MSLAWKPKATFPTISDPKSEVSSYLAATCISRLSIKGTDNSVNKEVVSLSPSESAVGEPPATAPTYGYMNVAGLQDASNPLVSILP